MPIFSIAMTSAELDPRDVGVLESWNYDAHDTSPFGPSTQSHFTHPLSPGSSHPVHIPGPGLHFSPCTSSLSLFLSNHTSLCFFLSLSRSCPIPLSLIQFLSPYLFVHLSPGFRLSALCMQPCPGAQGTPVSVSVSVSVSLSLSRHVLPQALIKMEENPPYSSCSYWHLLKQCWQNVDSQTFTVGGPAMTQKLLEGWLLP